jgi:hypothetical protein
LTVLAIGSNSSTIFHFIDNQSPAQAHRQSFGYINVPKWKWQSQRKHYKSLHIMSRSKSPVPTIDQLPKWFDTNVPLELTCPDEQLIEGGWWLCNLKHLNTVRRCTIYSTGPPLGLRTEYALAKLLPSCKIHFFDPYNATVLRNDNETIGNQISVHPWGFAGITHTYAPTSNSNASLGPSLQLKSLHDTSKALRHSHVDVLIVHCGGCEWTLDYQSIAPSQVLVRVTGLQSVTWFDTEWKNRYALFHKQSVVIGGLMGGGQSLSYLRLKSAFFA